MLPVVLTFEQSEVNLIRSFTTFSFHLFLQSCQEKEENQQGKHNKKQRPSKCRRAFKDLQNVRLALKRRIEELRDEASKRNAHTFKKSKTVAEVAHTPPTSSGGLMRSGGTSGEIDRHPEETDDSPVQSGDNPVQTGHSSVESGNTPVESDSSPVEGACSLAQIGPSPTETTMTAPNGSTLQETAFITGDLYLHFSFRVNNTFIINIFHWSLFHRCGWEPQAKI